MKYSGILIVWVSILTFFLIFLKCTDEDEDIENIEQEEYLEKWNEDHRRKSK